MLNPVRAQPAYHGADFRRLGNVARVAGELERDSHLLSVHSDLHNDRPLVLSRDVEEERLRAAEQPPPLEYEVELRVRGQGVHVHYVLDVSAAPMQQVQHLLKTNRRQVSEDLLLPSLVPKSILFPAERAPPIPISPPLHPSLALEPFKLPWMMPILLSTLDQLCFGQLEQATALRTIGTPTPLKPTSAS